MSWNQNDQKMLDFYSQFLSQGDLCFDIGANVGSRVKIFLKLRSKVVAVEPQQECVRVLKSCFSNNPNLTIIQKALGKTEGETLIYKSDGHTISSLSREWINTVKESGRFPNSSWDAGNTVELTTLDQLIKTYGMPKFIKIDVEGYEYEVIQGLSEPVHTLSIEFTPEFSGSTFECMNYLKSLGNCLTNFSNGESFTFDFQEWISVDDMITYLKQFVENNRMWGDVYLRYVE